ncbi:Transcription initiation factor TFIID subunit 7 [Trichoplax sp. H2]|nr:Transcription initiation factor TFIID subunit 7 [Trichoplax sp. H2]|eukprot:RDD47313.1 Transcription initiation factor TFIID subunit 7 [Trichoplax sp. H2]
MSRWRREDAQYEHQFLVRLPPEVAKEVKDSINANSYKRKPLSIDFSDDCRRAVIEYGHDKLYGKMYDLPCIIESQKTVDRKTFYKSADVSQLLICKEDASSDEDIIDVSSMTKGGKILNRKELKKYAIIHGISPPLKNVRKRRFRKTAKKKYAHSIEVERELRRLFKEDVAAVKVSYEVVKVEEKIDDGRSEISELDGLDSTGPTSVVTNVISTTGSPYVDEINDVNDTEIMKDKCDDVAAMLHMSDDEIEEDNKVETKNNPSEANSREHIDSTNNSISANERADIANKIATVEEALIRLQAKIIKERRKIDEVPNIFLKIRLQSNLESLLGQENEKREELHELNVRLN